MQQDKTFLGTEPVGQLLRRLAIPTVIAQLVNMLYNIVDRIYIGHIPEVGSSALTGVGVCLPIILIVSAFACFTASGGAPRASIYMGRNDMDSAEKTLGGCFTLQIGISVVLTAALLLWGRKALLAFGASENTIDYAADYLHIYAFGTLFVELTLGMNAFITAQGFAKVGMYTVLIGAAANIVLDPIFIFALGMGVRGAALATVLSQGLSCAWVLVFLCGKKAFLRLRRENLFVSPKLILPCVALGLATFTMQASESVISVCFNASLLKYGGDIAVGAMTILTSVMQFAMLPLQGIGQGAQPITSYNFGAKNTDRVRETFRLLLKVCLIYSVSLWLLIELFPRPVRAHLHAGRGAHRLHGARAAHLLRGPVPVRHPDRLPDDVRVHRQRGVLDHRGRAAQVCAAPAADLSAAGAAARPDDGRVSGRAGRGRHCRHVHGHPVCDAVSQSPAQARSERLICFFAPRRAVNTVRRFFCRMIQKFETPLSKMQNHPAVDNRRPGAYNDSHIHSRGAASHAQFVFQPQKRQHRDHVRGRLRML